MKGAFKHGVIRPFIIWTSCVIFPFGTAHAQAVNSGKSERTVDQSDAGDHGDIVVTALKRSTNLQDTPIAISAVVGSTLAQMGIDSSTGLEKVSPGLVIRESPFSGSRYTIRNIFAAGEPTVGVYYDETPVIGSSGVTSDSGGTLPDIRLFDVDRVEVLRGPQGTLYGSSSMAGTVRMIFAKPDTSNVSAMVSGEMQDVDGGGLGFLNQAMVNLPIVDDKVAVRAVGFYQDKPGYVDNVLLGQSNVNDAESYGGRIMVRVRPISDLTIDGLAVIQNFNGSLNDYALAAGPYHSTYEALQPVKDDFRLYSGTLRWDFGPIVLTAIGSHSYRDFNYSYDFSSYFRINALSYPVGSALYEAFNGQAPAVANSPQITNTDTAELRISSGSDGVLHWAAGLFYSDRNGNFDSNVVSVNPINGLMLPIGPSTLLGQRTIGDELKQTAGYGEATYDLTTKLSITGGLRYFHYDRRTIGAVTVPNPFVGFTPGPPTDQSSSEGGFLYKGNISYKITDRVMAYATIATGERPGGINQTVGLPTNLLSYKADKAENYELGLKSQFFDRLLTFNVDVFQIDWSNMQTLGMIQGTAFSFIDNVGRARIRGVEAEATLRPAAGLEIGASGSYIDARLQQDQINAVILAPGKKGDFIPFVPKVTLQGSIQYSVPISRSLKTLVRSDVYYSGSSWTDFQHTSVFQQYLPAYATVALRAGLSGINDDWSVSIYVDNLTNNDAQISKLSNFSLGSLDNVRAISLPPRTYGVQLTKRF
jgi:outer membrane receptor protein involved in Fe transport